ncbi:MAG: glycosyltransferase family 2 protein [Candidatus Azobacteroides sp.]|nr:glycosyltransferase family 2 protein [Candidatus Azobacteroides sp.]
MHKVAIVILNWNGKELLEKFLPFLFCYTDSELAEIIVADNSSTDGSVSFLKEHYPAIRLIELVDNYGFAKGYNEALKLIKHEYVVLLNSDVEVSENWLVPMIDYLDRHPEIAACQPQILSWRKKNYYEYAGAAGGFIDKYGYPFCRGRIFNTIEKVNPAYADTINIFWASGACLLIRLKDFLHVGGFDEEFFAHMEEIDLCWRLKIAGRNIVCIPKSTVYHVGGATLTTENPQKTYLNFRNNLLMLYKNLPLNRRKRILFIRSILDYLAALEFFISGKAKNAEAVLKAKKDFVSMKKKYICTDNEKKIDSPYGIFPEIYSKSILYDYYIKKEKYFFRIFTQKENV